MDHKVCIKCGLPKPPREYYIAHTTRDRLDTACKDCRKERAVELYRARGGGDPARRERDRIRKAGYRDMLGWTERRSALTDPNLLDLVDRSERRADLAEIGGLPGVHRIKERYRRLARLKEMWGEVPPEVMDAEGLELPSSPMADEKRRDAC